MISKIQVIKPYADRLTSLEGIREGIKICELAGRTCYKSEELIKEDSAEKFLSRIIKSGHESVIEHGNITYRIVGSRAMSHQLVRHRLNSFSQESQRYCNYTKDKFSDTLVIISPLKELPMGIYHQDRFIFNENNEYLKDYPTYLESWSYFLNSVFEAIDYYNRLIKTLPSEDARFVLPNATKTEVVMTANFRQWRHVIKERAVNPHAQYEIKGLMMSVYYDLKNTFPFLVEGL